MELFHHVPTSENKYCCKSCGDYKNSLHDVPHNDPSFFCPLAPLMKIFSPLLFVEHVVLVLPISQIKCLADVLAEEGVDVDISLFAPLV